MGTLTFTLQFACPSNGHFGINVTGSQTANIQANIDEIMGGFTEEEKRIFMLCALRLIKVGRTLPQMKTALEGGLTVTF